MNARNRLGAVVVAVLALSTWAMATHTPTATAAPGEVLMLDSTLVGGAGGTLAQQFVAAGRTPVVVNGTTWSSMTTADFAEYDAIVLGDPNCAYGPSATNNAIGPAVANASVWSAAVDGNVIAIGTDEQLHQASGGAALMEKAAAFTVAEAGKTGAYISLSCYYHGTAPGTPLPLMDGFGNFTVTGVPGCFDDAHIVATHPALAGLTDATLSNWGCSVHEAFDSWPLDFEVLAIARGAGAVYTASDGTVGTPYILARGVEVISDIRLTPEDATNDIGTEHTVTATLTTDDPVPDTPIADTDVTFSVIAGPHAGTTGTGTTGATGETTFTYTGTAAGTDTIEATFVDSSGRTQRSNRVTKTWRLVEICGNGIDDDEDGEIDEGCNEAPDCSAAAPTPAVIWPPNHKMVDVAIGGLTDPDGDTLSVEVTSIYQDEPTNSLGDGNTETDGDGVGTSTASVRAERSGNKKIPGNGRVYHVSFTVEDGAGGSCSGVVTVGVPHDQGKRSTPVDDGPLYDSTQP